MADAPVSPRAMDNGSSRRDRSRSRSPRRNVEDNEVSVNNGSNLYVSGLSNKTRDQDLEDLFRGAGNVIKASVVLDPHTRESRRFAFVDMENATAADKAIELYNGYELHERRLVVEKAKRKGPREPTPGRYYGTSRSRRDDNRRDYRRDDYRGRDDRDYRRDDFRRDDYHRRDDYRDDRDHRRDYRGYDREPRRDYDRGYDRYDRGPDRYDRSPRRF